MPNRLVPAGLASLIAVASVASFVEARHYIGRRDLPAVEAVAAAQAASISAELRSDAALLRDVAATLGDAPSGPGDPAAFAPSDPAEAVGVVRAGRSGSLTLTAVVHSTAPAISALDQTDLSAQPDWKTAFELGRDTGTAVAAAAPATTVVLEVLGLYGTPIPPATVDARRRELRGYVAILRPAASLAGVSTRGLDTHVATRLMQHSSVLTGSPTSTGGAIAAAVPVSENGVDWIVQGWSTQQSSGLPWAMLVVGLLVAMVVGAAAAIGERRSARLAAEALARASELDLIARTGGLLQESLELADLLPLFAVEVTDRLNLRALTISTVSESGDFQRVFSLGNPALPDRIAQAAGPSRGVVHFPLHRSGRLIGDLTVETTSALGHSQMEVLRAVSDLLAAALGNAKLFQDEQDMVARLRELDQVKATFLSSVSHELRTTVIAIAGFAGLLASEGSRLDDGRRCDFIERIQRNAQSLSLLIEDLLDSARLERLGIACPLQPVDLTDLVPKVVDQMSSILGPRPVLTSLDPDVVATADAVAVERILVNLLSNAAKYTPDDTEVMVSVSREGHDAILVVADRGPGIQPADRPRVFERFFRVDNEAGRRSRGVGIGLSLAKQFTELLGGTIGVDETPGGGARFRVAIPLFDSAAPEHLRLASAGPR